MSSTHLFYPILIKIEFSWQIFGKILLYQVLWKSFQWEPSFSIRTDGRTEGHTDTTKLIVVFRFSQFCEPAYKGFLMTELNVTGNLYEIEIAVFVLICYWVIRLLVGIMKLIKSARIFKDCSKTVIERWCRNVFVSQQLFSLWAWNARN
jgi:hypothetical protein